MSKVFEEVDVAVGKCSHITHSLNHRASNNTSRERFHNYLLKPAEVVSNKRLSEGLWRVEMRPISRECLNDVKPLQFFMVWIPSFDEIPLSVSDLTEDTISFIYKVRGLGTKALSALRPGSFVGLKGPLGNGFEVSYVRPSSKALIVAGGSGIAPVPYLIKKLAVANVQTDVVWGVKSDAELFNLREVLPDLDVRVFTATEDCSAGYCGLASQLAVELLNEYVYSVLIAIGPKPMLRSLCSVRLSGGLEFYVALEAVVKCGLGACGSCVLEPTDKLLCVDGPVFRCGDVKEHLMKGGN